ncbi:hypothetical protein MKY64_30345 [Paenibacillus sp. FSL R7-0210]|uniref:hypothetical protein n=1 Tax=Paenibacillus sp. FSL R7-0210 TaxID=2921676 RepID=UPI0030F8A148
MSEHFKDGEKVVLIDTGEVAEVKRWSVHRIPESGAVQFTYTLVGHESTFYFHHELKKEDQNED